MVHGAKATEKRRFDCMPPCCGAHFLSRHSPHDLAPLGMTCVSLALCSIPCPRCSYVSRSIGVDAGGYELPVIGMENVVQILARCCFKISTLGVRNRDEGDLSEVVGNV